MGCNTEYHLGCLHKYCPRLFQTKNDDATEDIDDGAFLAVDNFDDNNDDLANSPRLKIGTMTNKDGIEPSSAGPLVIPTGEIYCTECHSMGTVSVLVRYLNMVKYKCSHFAFNCLYVIALLEKHMTDNPEGNVVLNDENEGGDKGGGGAGADGD